MISVSDLSEQQITAIKEWVAEGAQMADVQKRLNEEFDFKVTYMDTRLLALDLELDFQEDEEKSSPVQPAADSSVVLDDQGGGQAAPPAGGVDATLDQVTRPGAMVSGTVTFSDGMKGIWMIDEMGRPSVDPDQAGYQPSEMDLMAFQERLRTLLDGKF